MGKRWKEDSQFLGDRLVPAVGQFLSTSFLRAKLWDVYSITILLCYSYQISWLADYARQLVIRNVPKLPKI